MDTKGPAFAYHKCDDMPPIAEVRWNGYSGTWTMLAQLMAGTAEMDCEVNVACCPWCGQRLRTDWGEVEVVDGQVL